MKSRAEITDKLSKELQGVGVGLLPKAAQGQFLAALVKMYENGILDCLATIDGTDAWYHAHEEYEAKWKA